MSAHDRPQPELDVELHQTSPVRGVVRCGMQPSRPFEGWIELAAAVQACVQAAEMAAVRTADGRLRRSA